MHIGLIGGIGPAATDYYYRGLISRNISSGTKLDLSIAHADARELTQNIARSDARQQAEIFAWRQARKQWPLRQWADIFAYGN
jgi:aspartate racemase